MPKPFKLLLEVEEVALGAVMNLLARTPGVMRVDPLIENRAKQTAAANGHDRAKPATLYKGDQTAEQYLMSLLVKKKKLNAKDMQEAFGKVGRKPVSYASAIWGMKKDGLVQRTPDGIYSLTKRGRDKARYV